MKPMSLPVFTLSPICNSHIVTDLSFCRLRLAEEGKQGSFILGHLKGLKLNLIWGKEGKDILGMVVVVVVVVVVVIIFGAGMGGIVVFGAHIQQCTLVGLKHTETHSAKQ